MNLFPGNEFSSLPVSLPVDNILSTHHRIVYLILLINYFNSSFGLLQIPRIN